MSTHSPNLWGVFSETSSIIRTHFRHFLALSILFLLPISVCAVIYPFLLQPNSIHSNLRRSFLSVSTPKPENEIPPLDKPEFLVPILFVLFNTLFSLSAAASITYSAFRGFYGRPVKFVSSLKSILVSFLPVLATKLVVQTVFALIGFPFGILAFLAYNWLAFLGIEMDYDSPCLLVLVILMSALLVGTTVYLQVEWFLSTVVVVVESKWGFTPLKRSSNLVKGMRGVVFSMIMFFAIPSVLLSVWYWNLTVVNRAGISWQVVLQMVVFAVATTTLSLYSMAATTVLFVYCRALHGDIAFQIDEELGVKYARLPGDDGKAPYAVSVVAVK